MVEGRVLLVGIYDTNTVALAPQILRAFAEAAPIGERWEIRTLDLSIFSQSVDEMERLIRAEDAAVVGFSTYIWNHGLVRELARRLPSTIILGGPMFNALAPTFFDENPGVDVVVTGEGEETFVELLEAFGGERSLETVAGISTPRFTAPPRGVIADLCRVPSPYARVFREHPNLEWIAYETSRGCPFLCGFCTWGYSKKMRYHPLDRVLSDLGAILAEPSIDRIYLCDSSILLDKPRATAILRHVIAHERDVTIRYEFNAEHLDDEIIDLLLQLPDNELNFGVQAVGRPALKTMRRPFKPKKFEASYDALVRRPERVQVTMDVIYGLPGDDLAGYEASLDYVMSFDHVSWILTNPLILLPGSDFHRDRERHGIVVRDEESLIVESTRTFPKAQMKEAIQLSFWVSIVYMNARLRDAVRDWARSQGQGYVEVIRRFFEALPLTFVDGDDYPYLVPSVAEDFRKRNLAIHRVVEAYPELIAAWDAHTALAHHEVLADYADHFGPQFRRLSRFAREEVSRVSAESRSPGTGAYAQAPTSS
jgi:radical SAM superfamily enzyme YgiQ (UPF0313 family)